MSAQEYYTLEAARLQRENAELLAYKAAADEALSYTLETTQDERAKELSMRALNVGAHGAGQEDTVKTHGIKQARCSNEDLDLLRAYFENVETHIEECDDSALGAWLRNTWDQGAGRHWLRLISGYETLVDNACDKRLPYLEWKPEIKNLQGDAARLLKANNEVARLNVNMQIKITDLRELLARISEHASKLPISIEDDIRKSLAEL